MVNIDEGDRYFTIAAEDETTLGSSAWFGLAGNALRRGEFGKLIEYTDKPPKTGMNQMRVADLLGHLHLYHAQFARAAASYSAALEHARQAEVPLYIGRALRHLALAWMWLDPSRALAVLPEARERNQSIDGGVGLAHCEMAMALVCAHRNAWTDAERHLTAARRGLEIAGAAFEFVPVEPLEVLVYLAQGRSEDALAVTNRLITATRLGRPLGPPTWAAITGLWVSRPDWYDFDDIDWIDPTSTRDRWLAPLARLRVTGHDPSRDAHE